ncbi:rod shape-determining protein MreD [Porphyrobacter sp. CACIAM 03H1]|jgi:rod shape-determining protein MreD|uniref:rod shape-determining protein MreD n=1 Tax=Porphyrobacter sp. CACIAM 03H1 TaxID=2003315 RepID=UPI000B5A7786|nr:rod shape-determining protein MreD [Porphyrobacter sp. CACIAM 03H1]ASJ91268.1 rod shape-determining protein MreD [Porphyrobacter sp. CACIAM 03H1]
MERLDPRARSDIYGLRINRAPDPWRVRGVPYASIILGSLLPVLLIADLMPLLPSFGFLMLLAWRMVRPGLLPLWAGAPLGAFDDLVSGQPFGSAILLWSLTMIAIEIIETRFPWRDFWHDWFTASVLALAYWLAALLVSGASVTPEMISVAAPQALLSVLLYPIIARMVAGLDRFRLSRARTID